MPRLGFHKVLANAAARSLMGLLLRIGLEEPLVRVPAWRTPSQLRA